MDKIAQRDRVLQYIRDFGSITTLQAFQDLGITRLSARIFELKEKGYAVKTDMVTAKNRYGENVHFKRYSIYE